MAVGRAGGGARGVGDAASGGACGSDQPLPCGTGADAETGADEEAAEGEATEEEGPPWTYQMARISIALILILVAGVGLLYYKHIASRQKGTA